MTPKQEAALRLALEALEHEADMGNDNAYQRERDAIREALAEQPAQQEPVAYIRNDQLQKAAQSPMLCEVTPEPRQDRIGIFTSPQPSKPWAGLTDCEREKLRWQALEEDAGYTQLIKATEAKLKEKNA